MSFEWTALGAFAGSWILTVLVHATVLLAAAALAAVALRSRPELEEAAWKVALVGGLLTASLQLALAGAAPGAATAVGDPVAASLAVAQPAATAAGASFPAAAPAAAALGRAGAEPPLGEEWRRWLAAAWGAVAALLLLRLAIGWIGLRRRLAGRSSIPAGPLRGYLERLLRRGGRRLRVSLSASERIPVPLATRREICLPGRVLRELPPGEQRSVVAHELAHVLRRDPQWLLTSRVLAALFFFHPLVSLAGRRLRQVAEERCDDWAVAATGSPVALARCLARVAGWRRGRLPAAAMAAGGGRLPRRVARLLDRAAHGAASPRPRPRWLVPAAVALLLAVALWVPGISIAGDPAPVAAAPAAAPPAPEVPPVLATAPAAASEAWPAFAIPAPGPPAPFAALSGFSAGAELEETYGALAAELGAREWQIFALAGEAGAVPAARMEEELASAMAAVAERLESRQEELEARLEVLASESSRLEAEGALSEEERRRLLAEARAAAAPLREEMEALGQQARRLALEAMPRPEDLDLIRAEAAEMARQGMRIAEESRRLALENSGLKELNEELARQMRQMAEQLRIQVEESLRNIHPELERLRHELEIRGETRQQLRQSLQAIQPQLEELRQELRLRDEDRERLRRELEAVRSELEQLRRERRDDGGAP